MNIAIVTAMATETLPILNKLGAMTDHRIVAGVELYTYPWQGHTIYLAQGGVGELRAALTVQLLCDLYPIDAVLNFGFAGALDSTLRLGELVLVDRVCHYQFDTSLIDGTPVGQYWDRDDRYFYLDPALLAAVQSALPTPLRVQAVASGDVFVASPQQKQYLRTFLCGVCEMELAGLAMACERNAVPLLSIKVMSDMADEAATMTFAQVVALGMTQCEAILQPVLTAVCRTVGGAADRQ